ncbi:hypothetical protein P152DRAFT_474207 [Eremomyces bilateralis CBS 781.70]|uniref:Uncharacterized protein n=1 Tax=Eremomyces bilateralis CBS 781.70 TaxID=1392243 RepID=A0A6G1G1S3_9PEZI|nr:uncharacterized protein P152DRAFT_474207 [Eremomyces bilateralis CBS 781.70]KAF1811968.1 hypothetical protein P152DRAFT_474207 [Eremomyces bilateralis CBS 781.70]
MDEAPLALAALLIAVIALVNTIGQVLHQYYASADGYRRCSSAVIGSWARFTTRRFKWREFRFETIFATPHIFLDAAYDLQRIQTSPTAGPLLLLDGTPEMDRWEGLQTRKTAANAMTFAKETQGKSTTSEFFMNFEEQMRPSLARRAWSSRILSGFSAASESRTRNPRSEAFLQMRGDPVGNVMENEPVSWIPLMQCLQSYSSELRNAGLRVFQDTSSGGLRQGRVIVPAVRMTKKSWDFVPPDVLKPYAVSTIMDVAIMVQLLGMCWKTFKPEEGTLLAESDGSMVTSSLVKPLGTMLTFAKMDRRAEDERKLHGIVFSPVEGATLLGFGIIPADFGIAENVRVFSTEQWYQALSRLTKSKSDIIRSYPDSCINRAMLDFIAINCPVLRPNNTCITYLVKPSDQLDFSQPGIRGALRAFTNQLLHLNSTRESPEPFYSAILLHCSAILAHPRWGPLRGRPAFVMDRYSDDAMLDLLNKIHAAWYDMATYCIRTRHLCRSVLAAHLHAVMTDCQEHFAKVVRDESLEAAVDRDDRRPVRRKATAVYFTQCLPAVVQMCGGGVEKEKVEMFWVAMMFKGVFWHAIHNFDDRVVAVPPRYWESNLPVYIA